MKVLNKILSGSGLAFLLIAASSNIKTVDKVEKQESKISYSYEQAQNPAYYGGANCCQGYNGQNNYVAPTTKQLLIKK